MTGPLNPWRGDGQAGFHIWCPGCDCPHSIRTEGPGPSWTFDGNETLPTFTPSLRVTSKHAVRVCHSFITAGQIQFLGDCTHHLVGQTVPLPPYPEDWK